MGYDLTFEKPRKWDHRFTSQLYKDVVDPQPEAFLPSV
jgi:hypothetical protein